MIPADPKAAPLLNRLERYLAESMMGYTERFDVQAARFYQETGVMAPGKSMPPEMYQQDSEREHAWAKWQDAQREQWRDLA